MRSASWPKPTAELPKSTPEPASPSSPAGPPHESQVGRNQAGTRQSASPPRAPDTSDVRVLRCGDQLVEVARRGPGYILSHHIWRVGVGDAGHRADHPAVLPEG